MSPFDKLALASIGILAIIAGIAGMVRNALAQVERTISDIANYGEDEA